MNYVDLCEHHGVREWGRRAPLAVRLLRAVVVDPDGCWLWQGGRDGYFGVRLGRGDQFRTVRVHRAAYEMFVGPIPSGLEVDHLCRQPSCCNPQHLEPVTGRENKMRGTSFSAINARKTHCKRGHEFTADNTIITARGNRTCRTCHQADVRAYLRRKSQEATARMCSTDTQDAQQRRTVQGLREGESE